MPVVSIAQPPYVPLAVPGEPPPEPPPDTGGDALITPLTITEVSGGAKSNEFLYFGFPMAANALAADQTLAIFDDDGAGGKGPRLNNFQIDNTSSDFDGKRRFVSVSAIKPSLGANNTRVLQCWKTTTALPSGVSITKNDILTLAGAANGLVVVTVVIGGITYTARLTDALGGGASFSKTAACEHLDQSGNPWRRGPCLFETVVSIPFRTGTTAHASGDGLRCEFHLKAFKAGVGAVSGGNPILGLECRVRPRNGHRSVLAAYTISSGNIARATSLINPTLITTNDTDPEGRTIVYSWASSFTHWGGAGYNRPVFIGQKRTSVVMLGNATLTGGTAANPTNSQLLDYLQSTNLFPNYKLRHAELDHAARISRLNATSRSLPLQFSTATVGGATSNFIGNVLGNIEEGGEWPDRGVVAGWTVEGVIRYIGDGRRLIFENAEYLDTQRTHAFGLNYGSATQRFWRNGDIYPTAAAGTAGDPWNYGADDGAHHETEQAYTAYLLTGDYLYYDILNARVASYGGYANQSTGSGQNMTWVGDWSKGGQWNDHYVTGGSNRRWIKNNAEDRAMTWAVRSVGELAALCPDRMTAPNQLSWDKSWAQTFAKRHLERYRNVIIESTGPGSTYNRFGVSVMRYFTDFGHPWQQSIWMLGYHNSVMPWLKLIGCGNAHMDVVLDWLARWYVDQFNSSECWADAVFYNNWTHFGNTALTAPMLTIAQRYERLALRNPYVTDDVVTSTSSRWNFSGTATASATSGTAVTITLPQNRLSTSRATWYVGKWFAQHNSGSGRGQITAVLSANQIRINTTVATGAAFTGTSFTTNNWSLPPPACPEDNPGNGVMPITGSTAAFAHDHYVDIQRAAIAMHTRAASLAGVGDVYNYMNLFKPDVGTGNDGLQSTQFDMRP